MKRRIIAVLIAALTMLGFAAAMAIPSQATVAAPETVSAEPAVQVPANHNRYGPQTYGGNVYNAYWSEGSINITDDRPVWSQWNLTRGSRSCTGYYTCNVQGFHVPSGWNAKNTKTGYIYVGGQWHYMCCNNTFLSLAVDWTGDPPPHSMGSIDGFNYEVMALKTKNMGILTGGVLSPHVH